MLTVSASTQFAVAALVMLVAAGGAFINFKLIALPMSEMVGGGDYLTETLRTSEVAALVIILVEALMGLFLMEALRFTTSFRIAKHHRADAPPHDVGVARDPAGTWQASRSRSPHA